jgi:hypothetical protein
MNKRVLIISYYFPPAGGPGVQRVLKFVKYLRGFGWEPAVLTVREGAFPDRDESLISDAPPDIRVFRTRSFNPFTLYAKLSGTHEDRAATIGFLSDKKPNRRQRLFQWIRANFFIPDARVGWYPFAVRAARAIIRELPVDVVMTSGPPHSVHLVGRRIHAASGIPWIADFRDPWTDISMFGQMPFSNRARRAHLRLEQKVLQTATGITTVSPSWQQLFQEKVPCRCAVVQNGFDEDDFVETQSPADTVFTIAHIGNLYGSRNPQTLWNSIADLQGRIPRLRIRIRFVGNVDEEVRASLERLSLDAIVEYIPYLSHTEAIARMKGSTVLLLSIERWHAAGGMITGKLYEYLAARRPILGIGPPDGDAARLIAECGAGAMFGWEDGDGMARFILDRYAEWERGACVLPENAGTIARYTRRNQTGKLVEFFDLITKQTDVRL